MNKTLRTTAEECLAEFRYNFISVVLDRVAHDEKENETQLEDMFVADLLGLKIVPFNNVLCWSMRYVADVSASAVPSSPAKPAETSKPTKKKGGKKSEKKHKKKKRREKKRKKKQEEASAAASATPGTADGPEKPQSVLEEAKSEDEAGESSSDSEAGKTKSKKVPVKTAFYKTLCILQEQYYKYIRRNIFNYLDKPAQERLTILIDQEEKKRGIPYAKRADKGYRLPWEWMRSTILSELCLPAELG